MTEHLAPGIGSANCLPPGSQVGEYRLLRVVGEGGFGVVYEARDLALDRIVAVKEYMPSTLAGRMASNQLHVRSQHRGAFDAGLRSFINEARLLAKFSHPALVHVYRFFEANGTAYMVMRYYEGTTFKGWLAQRPGVASEAWLAAMLAPILDVLEMLHAADCYHRDISPDNIFLQASGGPVLLDFGAARRIIGDLTQALTMVLKPGFAPIEQYVDDGGMPQGAWTDIYQLGAMLFLAATGRTPATAVARLIKDPTPMLTPAICPGFSEQFLRGIQHALAVKPEDRPQSIAAFRAALGLSLGNTVAAAASAAPPSQATAWPVAPPSEAVYAEAPAVIAAPEEIRPAIPMPPPLPTTQAVSPRAAELAPPAAAAPSAVRAAMLRRAAAGAAGLLVLAAALAWWNRGGEPEATAAEPSAVVPDAVRATPEPPAAGAEAAPPAGVSAPPAVASRSAPPATKPAQPVSARPTAQMPVERPPAAPPAAAAVQSEPPAPAATGIVVLRVAPWGRVSVNRVARGTAPPLRELQLPEGEHRIEITNPAAAPMVRVVQVKKGESIVLQHKFE